MDKFHDLVNNAVKYCFKRGAIVKSVQVETILYRYLRLQGDGSIVYPLLRIVLHPIKVDQILLIASCVVSYY
jgi:hypothetical protein